MEGIEDGIDIKGFEGARFGKSAGLVADLGRVSLNSWRICIQGQLLIVGTSRARLFSGVDLLESRWWNGEVLGV